MASLLGRAFRENDYFPRKAETDMQHGCLFVLHNLKINEVHGIKISMLCTFHTEMIIIDSP